MKIDMKIWVTEIDMKIGVMKIIEVMKIDVEIYMKIYMKIRLLQIFAISPERPDI